MNSKKLLIAIVFFTVLYSYVGKNIAGGLMAIPICLQFAYLNEKFGNEGFLSNLIRAYNGAFIFGYMVYLYSLNYRLNEAIYFNGMSDERRALTSVIIGLSFSTFLLLTNVIIVKLRKR